MNPASADLNFGHWTVDPLRNRLISAKRTMRLEPKVMDVFLCLMRHRGEVVSKEELLREVWSGTFVTEDSLKRCISQLRKAFRDESSVIQTIPKRGYCLSLAVVNSGDLIQPGDRRGQTNPATVFVCLRPDYYQSLVVCLLLLDSLLKADQALRPSLAGWQASGENVLAGGTAAIAGNIDTQ